MSALGQKRTFSLLFDHLIADIAERAANVRLTPEADGAQD
jgi:hypothetical protein